MTTGEYEAAVLEHKDRVHSYARRILRDHEDAKDVTQECLVRLWRDHERVDPGAGCRSWLLRSAHNMCVDRLRRRSTRPETARQDDAPDPVDGRPGPDRLTSSAEVGDRLERALLDLDHRDRSIVLLREVEGLAYDEIAELLGVKMGTLKATLHRAREKLRHALVRAEVTP